ncbi:di-heme oxidoredictase family protein [Zoogloea sp.]|uniref:di-heme oxidoreductase family protein n=1 Tax=Zoogloea sp. TaxID=49181 RepID=UPI0014159D99|nr:MAG: c-type cytochrome [Zoogloea sp.]
MGGLLLRLLLAGLLGCLASGALGGDGQVVPWQVADAGREAFSRPMAGLAEAERERFFRGRSLFNQSWVVAPAKDDRLDGLGPLYNRLACVSCHARNGRGLPPESPGERMQSMLLRLSVPGVGPRGGPRPHPVYGDQFNEEAIPGVMPEGRAELRWLESRRRLPDGSVVSLRRPRLSFRELGYGAIGQVRISPRVGQQVVGMGLLDAVPDATLEALAAEAKPDGVKGRVNRIGSEPRELGRFGHKANMSSLRAQIAGAFLGDLGITSTLHRQENCTSVQAACRRALTGGEPELDDAQLDDVEFYLAHLAVPARRQVALPQVQQGEVLFARVGCASCHRPALRTGDSPRFPGLAGVDIAPYTDLLIHDMGPGLSDGRPDFQASGREWRTPPLWGIGLAGLISERARYLHDGRARSLTEAVLWHGGEASMARRRFEALARREREALLAFLESL